MNSANQNNAVISRAILLLGGPFGMQDIACPACGPLRHSAGNQRRKVLRVWRLSANFATYVCACCGESGFAREDDAPPPDRAALAKAKAEARRCAARAAVVKQNAARWLWSQRRPIDGTLAERYLRDTRRIGGPLPPTLGFLPARGEHVAAMIAAFGLPVELNANVMTISTTAIRGVHLTRLAADGSGKAGTDADKIMIGSPLGAPIALAFASDLGGLAIAEGIEDALSVHEATGLGAWAAGSASLLPALAAVVPTYIEVVTVLVDDDAPGRHGANELAIGLERRGIEVRLVTPNRSTTS